jgi:hypothetical protein
MKEDPVFSMTNDISPIEPNFHLEDNDSTDRKQIIYIIPVKLERVWIPTELYVKPEHWDKASQRVLEPYDTGINKTLETMEAKAADIKSKYKLSTLQELDWETFRKEFLGY